MAHFAAVLHDPRDLIRIGYVAVRLALDAADQAAVGLGQRLADGLADQQLVEGRGQIAPFQARLGVAGAVLKPN